MNTAEMNGLLAHEIVRPPTWDGAGAFSDIATILGFSSLQGILICVPGELSTVVVQGEFQGLVLSQFGDSACLRCAE
jgi:hypothetical protein